LTIHKSSRKFYTRQSLIFAPKNENKVQDIISSKNKVQDGQKNYDHI